MQKNKKSIEHLKPDIYRSTVSIPNFKSLFKATTLFATCAGQVFNAFLKF